MQLSTRVRAHTRAWRVSSVLSTLEKSQCWLGYESEQPSAVTDWKFNLECGSHVSVNWHSVRRACAGSRMESSVLATIEKVAMLARELKWSLSGDRLSSQFNMEFSWHSLRTARDARTLARAWISQQCAQCKKKRNVGLGVGEDPAAVIV